MKRILSFSLLVASSVALISCDSSQDDSAKLEQRLAELEEERQEDLKRQKALELELAEQKIAREWEAIERERLQIAEAHLEAESRTAALASAEVESLRLRDAELAEREAKAALWQADLIEERALRMNERQVLDDQALALAGLDAGDFAPLPDDGGATIDDQFFYQALSPYGLWFETEEYGAVWQPAACSDPAWRPYSRGHWACSDQGWAWISTEPFGWATYHYGRWALLENARWIWVPGTEWAPSWCTWRTGTSFVGWAPLPPETLVFANQNWDADVESQYGISVDCFNFIDIRHFDRPISSYCLPAIRNRSYHHVTSSVTKIRVGNQRVFCGGPGYRDLSVRLKRPLPYYQIERSQARYDRPHQAHLASQVREGKLIVAAPHIRKTETGIRPPGDRQVGISSARIKRTPSANSNALKAYENLREQERKSSPTPRPDLPATAQIIPVRPSLRSPSPLARNEKQARLPDSENTVARREQIEKEELMKAVEERRRLAEVARREEGLRAEVRRKSEEEAQRLREEADRRARATAEARQQKERQQAEESERDAMRQKAEAQERERQAALAREKAAEESARRAAMREAQEAERRARAAAEARQEKERQQAEERARDAMRQKAEAERQRQAEEEARRQKQEEAERARKAEEERKQMEEERRREREREEDQRRRREEAQQKEREDQERRQREEGQRSKGK